MIQSDSSVNQSDSPVSQSDSPLIQSDSPVIQSDSPVSQCCSLSVHTQTRQTYPLGSSQLACNNPEISNYLQELFQEIFKSRLRNSTHH